MHGRLDDDVSTHADSELIDKAIREAAGSGSGSSAPVPAPVVEAAFRGDLEALKTKLSGSSSMVNEQDGFGNTALLAAVYTRNAAHILKSTLYSVLT